MPSSSSPAEWVARVAHRAAVLALAIVVVAAFAAWPWTGWSSTWWRWAGVPDAFLAVPLVSFLGAATLLHGRWRWLGRLLASAAMAWLWSSYRVLKMGDGHWWREAAEKGTVTWAEPLTSHLHIALHRVAGAAALEWLPVFAGALATWAWLAATDGLLARRDASSSGAGNTNASPVAATVATGSAGQRLAAALLWCSSGIACAFFHRYVEATQLGVPGLLLGLAALTRWSRDVAAADVPAAVPMRGAFVGAAWLVLAMLLHAMYVGMFAAAIGASLLAALRAPQHAKTLALAAGAMFTIALGAAALVLRYGPLNAVVGSIAGGSDTQMLTPWDQMLSAPHVALVTFLLAYGTPMVLPLAIAALARPVHVTQRTEPVAAAAAVAYLAFVGTYGFDLGWPDDADLMLAMGAALSWLVANWLLPRVNGLALVLLALATLATCAITTRLVRPLGVNISQANSALAALRVDGIATEGRGPFDVPTEVGETLVLHASGPVGAEFYIVLGPPSPAFAGHPYGGVADIVPDLLPDRLVHMGRFGPDGRASVPFVVRTLPDGTLPGVQMLVYTAATASGDITSAALYLRAR